ncbi:MAG: sugar phosphate isomerase/epimerase family protein, partial [Saccharofermentanales bacterium]
MRIGVRAHDFGKSSPEKMAKMIGNKNLTSIQLALSKAIEGLDPIDGRLTPGLANYIGETFRKRNIHIAVFGCYINPIHPDKLERKKQLNRFKEHLRYARDLGCSVVGTETGSINPDFSFHPENHSQASYEVFLESLKELVEEAERFGVIVGIEGVKQFVVHSPQIMRKTLDDINSNNLQVIFDPVNFINIENYLKCNEITKEAFELFGERIIAFHAKDFIIDDGKIKLVPIGKGVMDFTIIIELLKKHKPYINFIIEETNIDTIDESLVYINEILKNSFCAERV